MRGLLIKQEESGVDLLSHTVKCNIIGAEAFHGPVRDGKGWFHLAMDTRRKGLWLRFWMAVCVDDAAALSTHYLEEVLVVNVFLCLVVGLKLNVIGSSLTGN